MRKELTVYVNTNERGVEISVSSLASNRKFILVNTGSTKFTMDVSELKQALQALEEFNEGQGNSSAVEAEVAGYMNIEYGAEDQEIMKKFIYSIAITWLMVFSIRLVAIATPLNIY